MFVVIYKAMVSWFLEWRIDQYNGKDSIEKKVGIRREKNITVNRFFLMIFFRPTGQNLPFMESSDHGHINWKLLSWRIITVISIWLLHLCEFLTLMSDSTDVESIGCFWGGNQMNPQCLGRNLWAFWLLRTMAIVHVCRLTIQFTNTQNKWNGVIELCKTFNTFPVIGIFIDCETREIIHLVVSVYLFTVQDLCVFVSNQETFAIKSCAQRSEAFNVEWTRPEEYLTFNPQNSTHKTQLVFIRD